MKHILLLASLSLAIASCKKDCEKALVYTDMGACKEYKLLNPCGSDSTYMVCDTVGGVPVEGR